VDEFVAEAGDDFQVPRTAEVALDERDSLDMAVGGRKDGRPDPGPSGGVIVAPVVGQPAVGQRHHQLKIASMPEPTLDERRIAGHARADLLRTKPGKRRRGGSRVVSQLVPNADDDLQLARRRRQGALDQRDAVDIAAAKKLRPDPGIGPVVVVSPAVIHPAQLAGDHQLEVALDAKGALDHEAAACRRHHRS
jgi:hypothetical protein